jgi:hypothetical protein
MIRIGKVDAVMVESQQGSKHLAHAHLFLEAGLPVFVDKPFVNALADADVMINVAQTKGVPRVSMAFTEQSEVASGIWPSGQVGTVRGMAAWASSRTTKRAKLPSSSKELSFTGSCSSRLSGCFRPPPPIPYREMRELIAFIIAAEDSRKAGGLPVALA